MSQFEAALKGKSDSAAFALQLNLDMQASRCVEEEGKHEAMNENGNTRSEMQNEANSHEIGREWKGEEGRAPALLNS